MGQRNPWVCDCGAPDCDAVCDRSRPFALHIAFISADYKHPIHRNDYRKANYNGLPAIVEVLGKGAGNALISARCVPQLVPMLLQVSGSNYPLAEIERRVAEIYADVRAAIPPENREGYVAPPDPPADEPQPTPTTSPDPEDAIDESTAAAAPAE